MGRPEDEAVSIAAAQFESLIASYKEIKKLPRRDRKPARQKLSGTVKDVATTMLEHPDRRREISRTGMRRLGLPIGRGRLSTTSARMRALNEVFLAQSRLLRNK